MFHIYVAIQRVKVRKVKNRVLLWLVRHQQCHTLALKRVCDTWSKIKPSNYLLANFNLYAPHFTFTFTLPLFVKLLAASTSTAQTKLCNWTSLETTRCYFWPTGLLVLVVPPTQAITTASSDSARNISWAKINSVTLMVPEVVLQRFWSNLFLISSLYKF